MSWKRDSPRRAPKSFTEVLEKLLETDAGSHGGKRVRRLGSHGILVGRKPISEIGEGPWSVVAVQKPCPILGKVFRK